MHEVLVNRLGGLSLPRKSVVRLTDRPDMTLDVYRGRKITMQQCNATILKLLIKSLLFHTHVFFCLNRLDGSGDAEMSEEVSPPLVNWSHVADLIHPIKLILSDTLQEVAANYQMKVRWFFFFALFDGNGSNIVVCSLDCQSRDHRFNPLLFWYLDGVLDRGCISV